GRERSTEMSMTRHTIRWLLLGGAMAALAAPAFAQMMGGPMMMGGGSGGGMMGGMGQQEDKEPDPNKPVEQLQYALTQYLKAFAILELEEEQGGQGGMMGGMMGGPMGGGAQAKPSGPKIQAKILDLDLRSDLYTKVWQAYYLMHEEYRKRDQLVDAEAVLREALATLPCPSDAALPGGTGGAGGMMGGMMGGPMGAGRPGMAGSGGPMAAGTMSRQMMGGGPMMMGGGSGGPMMGGGMGGMMGGQQAGGARGQRMAEWDDLPPPEQAWLATNILPFAFDALAVVQMESGQFEEARTTLLRVVQEPGLAVPHRESMAHLAQVEILLGHDGHAVRRLEWLTGQVSMPGATGAFAPAPGSAVAWANLGLVYCRLGEYRSAIEALRQSLLIDPEDTFVDTLEAHLVAHNYLGVTWMRMGKTQAAESEFKAMLPLIEKADAQLVADADKKVFRYSQFRARQRRTLAAGCAALSNLGAIYQAEGRFQDALEHQRAAAKLADRLVLLEQRDPAATVDDHTKAQQARAMVLGNLGLAHIAAGADAQSAVHGSVDPRNAKGNLETAVAVLEQAVMANSGSAAAWNDLGMAYMRNRQYFSAEAAFQQAVTLQGSSDLYRWNLEACRECIDPSGSGGGGTTAAAGMPAGGGMMGPGMMGSGPGMMGPGPAGGSGPGMMGPRGGMMGPAGGGSAPGSGGGGSTASAPGGAM
ncbi:MAG TPA: tetratricopeptide repeat protein, partial [Armatimonadota bacterium]|nr:tetratricopeptide repeat protein [Armatimonadota bacterium]